MSGGTPIGGAFMRQRHSQGYTSGSDDHEDDACSRASPQSPSSLQQKTRRRWVEIMENVLWIASAVFIIYYGDRHSNFIVILWHDDRIRRDGVEAEVVTRVRSSDETMIQKRVDKQNEECDEPDVDYDMDLDVD
ncbi:uncharacterized protein LOC114277014 [Camellia sinensis]|uniref:uncharacterized protein LOC114277014 n=1 Tax=Camellia sinensis TaxID=4442 RepID=UPI0010362588|nr:uncharacterized protein LOC114277014 [Camellia sinensis]